MILSVNKKVDISIINTPYYCNIETRKFEWEVPTEAAKAVDGNDKEDEYEENKDQDQKKKKKKL